MGVKELLQETEMHLETRNENKLSSLSFVIYDSHIPLPRYTSPLNLLQTDRPPNAPQTLCRVIYSCPATE